MKKVLCVGESHASSTGFGIYTKQLLTRLYATHKYDIAQLSIYGAVNTPQSDNIKWKYYANAILPENPNFNSYRSNKTWTFGGWRFNEVLLDFQPDIVIDFRDPFMFEFEWISPLRPYFYWIISPTVDSAPQQEDWLDMFSSADAILTYSEFGKKVLEQELQITNISDYAYPGADLEIFRPLNIDKNKIKAEMMVPLNSNIIGTVMRNQIRKLYPDILKSFNLFLERASPEIQKNTFLYFHTSFPDMGWELDGLLNKSGLGHKILFTYLCRACHAVTALFFQGARTVCPKCKQHQCLIPNAENGVNGNELNKIYNIFDLYIQYASCEGAGMPSIEAGAAGIPVVAVDYSAMSDIVRLLDGIPMKPKGMFHSMNMGADRAYPDNEYLSEIMLKWVNTPTSLRKIHGQKTRKLAEKHFNWDDNAKKWEKVIDNAMLTDKQGKWNSPISLPTVNNPTLIEGSIKHKVYWVIDNIIGRPELKHTLFATKLINNIEQGVINVSGNFAYYTLDRLQSMANDFYNIRIKYERIRCGLEKLPETDYIKYAKIKQEIDNS